MYHFLRKLSYYQDSIAEELTQETFYRAFLGFDKFRGECRIETWLCQIAKNLYYKQMRERVKVENLAGKIKEQERGASVTEQVEEKQMRLQLREAIETLDERSKSIVLYRLYSQLSFKEIAYLTGIREATAKVIFSRAKVKIQDQLKERYGYEI